MGEFPREGRTKKRRTMMTTMTMTTMMTTKRGESSAWP